MKELSDTVLALFRFLDEERIEYCVVGDSRQYPAKIDSDIDLVVAPSALRVIPLLLNEFCTQEGMTLVQCLQHEQQAWYYVLSFRGPGERPQFLAVDICGDYFRQGRRLLSANELLSDRVAAFDNAGRARGFFVAAPAKEFCYYLLKRIDKGSLDPRHGEHLSEQWHRDPAGASAQIERFFSLQHEGGIVLRAAECDSWEAVIQALPQLRAALRRKLPIAPLDWLREQYRKLLRILRPTGLLVACLGPDGSGKSTIIRSLSGTPMLPFRRVTTMHLRPRLLRPQGGLTNNTMPHAVRPRSRVATVAKLLMFALDYWLGYWLRVRPALVRSTLVVSDRYYNDVFVDPIRYRMAHPRALAKLLLPWIPRPGLWLVFDAPSSVLQSRKREVSPAESARQRGEYRRLLRNQSNVVVLDATRHLDEVAAQSEAAIATHLAQRTAKRLGLPRDIVRNPLNTRLLLYFCRRDIPLLSKVVRILYNSDIYCRLPQDIHLPHPYGIVIHSQTAIGSRVTVMQQVTLGGKDQGENVAPMIGDGVYLGAGCRVLGDVRVGDGAVIGANAVVTRDVPAGATVVGANRIVSRSSGEAAAAYADGEWAAAAGAIRSVR